MSTHFAMLFVCLPVAAVAVVPPAAVQQASPIEATDGLHKDATEAQTLLAIPIGQNLRGPTTLSMSKAPAGTIWKVLSMISPTTFRQGEGIHFPSRFRQKTLLAALVVVGWVAAIACKFMMRWWFQLSDFTAGCTIGATRNHWWRRFRVPSGSVAIEIAVFERREAELERQEKAVKQQLLEAVELTLRNGCGDAVVGECGASWPGQPKFAVLGLTSSRVGVAATEEPIFRARDDITRVRAADMREGKHALGAEPSAPSEPKEDLVGSMRTACVSDPYRPEDHAMTAEEMWGSSGSEGCCAEVEPVMEIADDEPLTAAEMWGFSSEDEECPARINRATKGTPGASGAVVPNTASASLGSVPPKAPAPATANGGVGGMSDIFAAINGFSTGQLRKVTDDMKTKNRANDDVAPMPVAKAQAGPLTGGRVGRGPRGPPRMEMEKDTNFVIENYEGKQDFKIDNMTMANLVCVINCKNCTLQVTTKVKSINLDGCERVNLVCTDVLSTIELVNSDRCKVQILGLANSVAIDKCNGVNVWLSRASLGAEIVTSKSSEMNLTIPQDGGGELDTVELPIPEQFVTTVKGPRSLQTVASGIYA